MSLSLKHPCKKCISKPICYIRCDDFNKFKEQVFEADGIIGYSLLFLAVIAFISPGVLLALKSLWFLLLIPALWITLIIVFVLFANRTGADFIIILLSPMIITCLYLILAPYDCYAIKYAPKKIRDNTDSLIKDFWGPS